MNVQSHGRGHRLELYMDKKLIPQLNSIISHVKDLKKKHIIGSCSDELIGMIIESYKARKEAGYYGRTLTMEDYAKNENVGKVLYNEIASEKMDKYFIIPSLADFHKTGICGIKNLHEAWTKYGQFIGKDKFISMILTAEMIHNQLKADPYMKQMFEEEYNKRLKSFVHNNKVGVMK